MRIRARRTCYFNPRPPWGGRPTKSGKTSALKLFQSTPSVGRATRNSCRYGGRTFISIHALRGEGDDETARGDNGFGSFQSTPSVGRATSRCAGHRQHILDFNPRPPWGGRPSPAAVRYSSVSISIHALRGEGDKIGREIGKYIGISIHALRGEGDVPIRRDCFIPLAFQSTPSVGRATIYTSGTQAGRLFQSTPSVGRATVWNKASNAEKAISIHALRGEGDSARTVWRRRRR